MRLPLAPVVLLAACAPSVTSAQQYTIHYHPTVGKRLHYGMSMTTSGAQHFSVTSSFTMTATAHTGGKYTIVTTIESMTGPGASAAQTKKMVEGTKVTQIVDDYGKILSTRVEGPMKEMFGNGGMGTTGAIYPRKAVHIGETWEGSTDMAGSKTRARIKFVKVKSIGGHQAAVLLVTPLTQPSKVATTNPLTVTLDMGSGTLLSVEATGAMGMQTGMKSTMHLLIELKS